MDFLTNLQNKAQQALDKSGLADKIPSSLMTHTSMAQQPVDSQGNPVHGNAGDRMDAPDAGKSGGGRPLILENITHQLRALHNQYAPQGPPEVQHVQVLITDSKGIALDYQGVGKDAQSLSKDFYLWGQNQEEDLKDVTDRLAYVNFVHATLSTTLASSIEASRAPLKRLRDLLTQVAPRRGQIQAIEAQLRDLSRSKAPGADKRIAELQAERSRRFAEDEPLERELATVKRKAIRDSEEIKWKAIKEHAEKLLLLSETSTHILNCLPSTSPSQAQPYNAHADVAQARTNLQNALDHYQLGQVSQHGVGVVLDFDGSRGNKTPMDMRSFGESHQAELSRVPSMVSVNNDSAHQYTGQTTSPGQIGGPVPVPVPVGAMYAGGAHPLDPTQLNNTPAPIPTSPKQRRSSIPSVGSPLASTTATQGHPGGFGMTPTASFPDMSAPGASPETTISPPEPTVAETGMPISAGASGPGPARGSLAGGRTGTMASTASQPQATTSAEPYVGGFRQEAMPPSFATAEEEKRRLAAAYGGGATLNAPPPAQAPSYESAEDEKKRLEREERDKLLGAGSGPSGDGGEDGQAPPPPSYS